MNKLNCSDLDSVRDITDQCDYDDSVTGDSKDYVSCCQDNGYNELENKLKKYQSIYKNISVAKLLKVMCECCNEIEHSKRTHNKYDECIEKKN